MCSMVNSTSTSSEKRRLLLPRPKKLRKLFRGGAPVSPPSPSALLAAQALAPPMGVRGSGPRPRPRGHRRRPPTYGCGAGGGEGAAGAGRHRPPATGGDGGRDVGVGGEDGDGDACAGEIDGTGAGNLGGAGETRGG